MFRKFLMMAAVAVTAALIAPSESRAGFSVSLTGTSPVLATRLVLDRVGGAPANADDDQSGAVNRIVLGNLVDGIGSLYNGLSILMNAVSKSPNAELDSLTTSTVNTITNSSGGTVSVTIVITDDSFTAPVNGVYVLKNNLTIVSKTGVSMLETVGSATNSPATTAATNAGSPAPVSDSTSTFWTRTGSPSTFALTTTIRLTLANNGTVNFQTSLDVLNTPTPAGLLLAAFGIPAFGLLRRIGRKSGAAQVAV